MTGNDTYSEVSYEMELVQDVVYSIIAILGVVGNTFVLFIVLNSKSSMNKTLSSIFLINQSILDASASLLLGIEYWTRKLVKVSNLGSALLNWYCRGWYGGVFVWGLMIASTYNLVFLSLERLFSIKFPIRHKNLSRNKIIVCCLFIWLICISYQLARHVPTSIVLPNGDCGLFVKWPNTEISRAVGIITVFLQFLLPLILVTSIYVSLSLSFRNRVPSKSNDTSQRVRKNSIKTFTLVALAFVLCWIFNQVYFLLFNIGVVNNLETNFGHFSVIMVCINCSINPFIYTFRYDEFRRELQRYKILKKNNINPIKMSSSKVQNTQ